MSTDYVTKGDVHFSEIGRLNRFGVREHIAADTSARVRCLTDGNHNFLWIYLDDAGEKIACMSRYRPNGNPGKILKAIAQAFETEIYSEYEPQYWGFATQEEWDAAEYEHQKRRGD